MSHNASASRIVTHENAEFLPSRRAPRGFYVTLK
jgi:hypothetical protein